MEIHELVIEMKLLEHRLTLYEEKMVFLAKTFIKLSLVAILRVLMNMMKLELILVDGKEFMRHGFVGSGHTLSRSINVS